MAGGDSTHVLMLGTSLRTKGGITSVVKVYESCGLFSDWPVTYIETHVDGGPLRKLHMAASAWLSYAGWLIRDRKFVLHVHSASRASFWRKSTFIFPALWLRRPVIFHLHGGEFMTFYGEESGPLARWLVRHVLDRATRLVVLSETWRDSIASITDNPRVDVIVNPALPYQGPSEHADDGPCTLLFLGRIGEHKGIYVLLDAMQQLARDEVDVRLVCAGDGDIDKARAKVSEMGLEGRVDINGWIDEQRRNELLEQADAFVLPSYGEGLPMSIVEAMSAGLPVVATPVGGIPQAIRDGEEGLLVPVGDAPALAAAIRHLAQDREYRGAMGRKALATFDRLFSAEVVLPQVQSLYQKYGIRALVTE